MLAACQMSTMQVASGNVAAARFQIQAAPSPMMVSWLTWPAPRRIPSAVVNQLGGPAVLREVGAALDDVRRWWRCLLRPPLAAVHDRVERGGG
jgi:hypothetical protein